MGEDPAFEYEQGLPAYRWVGEYLSDMISVSLGNVPGIRVLELDR